MQVISAFFAGQHRHSEVAMWTGGLLFTGVLLLLTLSGNFNVLFALMLGSILLLVSLRSPVTASLMTLLYLNVMGDLRRMLAVTVGQPAFDFMLLIGPGVALVLAVPVLLRAKLKDSLSKAMLFLLVVMALEIVNPKQGGLAVGLSGAVFYIAPILWFWVGRRFASPGVVERLLYRILFPLCVFAAALGLWQTFIGFPFYQQAWIDLVSKTYTALFVGGSIRAFGFSVSGTEYATLLELGAAAAAAAYFGSRRQWAIIFPLLATTMLLASGRTVVIKLVLAIAIVWTVRKGEKIRPLALIRLGLFVSLGLIAVVLLASSFAPSGAVNAQKRSAAEDAIAHQAGGLAHPLDERYSTAGLHSSMFVSGVLQGIEDPIGRGLGATTLAAAKFGGDSSTGSSEVDVSDMFISLGLVGGLIYVCIIYLTARSALAYVRAVPLRISLPVLAILASTILAWLIGGQYSTSSLVCFLIGALLYNDNIKTGHVSVSSTHLIRP